jgi:NACalpha-BTF3-like transcription factor
MEDKSFCSSRLEGIAKQQEWGEHLYRNGQEEPFNIVLIVEESYNKKRSAANEVIENNKRQKTEDKIVFCVPLPCTPADLHEKDIFIVMKQANVCREDAIKSLCKTNGDIVNAIMESTL